MLPRLEARKPISYYDGPPNEHRYKGTPRGDGALLGDQYLTTDAIGDDVPRTIEVSLRVLQTPVPRPQTQHRDGFHRARLRCRLPPSGGYGDNASHHHVWAVQSVRT